MNTLNGIPFQALWWALNTAAQALFHAGTDHSGRELPLGELALSALAIRLQAQQLGVAGPAQPG